MMQKPQGGWCQEVAAQVANSSLCTQRQLASPWATGLGQARLIAAPAESSGEGNAWEAEGKR